MIDDAKILEEIAKVRQVAVDGSAIESQLQKARQDVFRLEGEWCKGTNGAGQK